MTRSLPDGEYSTTVFLTIIYFQVSYWKIVQSATPSYNREQPATDNGFR